MDLWGIRQLLTLRGTEIRGGLGGAPPGPAACHCVAAGRLLTLPDTPAPPLYRRPPRETEEWNELTCKLAQTLERSKRPGNIAAPIYLLQKISEILKLNPKCWNCPNKLNS